MKRFLVVLVAIATLFGLSLAANAFTYEETISSVVQIQSPPDADGNIGFGTGTIISADAVILTAAHVVLDPLTGEPYDYVYVCTIETEHSTPNCRFSAIVMGYDEFADLAVIQLSYEYDEQGNAGDLLTIDDMFDLELPYVDFADSNPTIGDDISILGFPGASLSQNVTLTEGIISSIMPFSAINPEVTPEDDFEFMFETDAIINPGNSGGPAYDEYERLIGVVIAVSTTGVGGNYGYIVSNNVVYLFFLDLVEQEILYSDYVEEIFSNDFIESAPDLNGSSLPKITFKDIETSHPNKVAIYYLYSIGVIDGYDDGTFKPDGEINRAELMKMVIEMMGLNPDAAIYKNCFNDVGTEWFARYVCYAKEQGWVEGYEGNLYKPANNTNRAEAIKIILNIVFGGEDAVIEILKTFPYVMMPLDVDEEAWYYNYLKLAAGADVLDLQHTHVYGSGAYNYFAGDNMTRKEVAEMIYRLIISEEELVYVAVLAEWGCYLGENLDASEEEAGMKLIEIFAEYGYEIDEADLLFENYGDNEGLTIQLEETMKIQCPASYEILEDFIFGGEELF